MDSKSGRFAYAKAYQQLNDEQKRAVDSLDGPLLVIAGPGTGKTQLLATRVGRILEQTDASGENILCLTFSESAVQAMKTRLISLIGKEANSVTVSTYHGFGRALIADYPEHFSPQVLGAQPADELVLDRLLREIISDLPYSNPLKSDFYIRDLKNLISGYKRALITPPMLQDILSDNLDFMNRATKIIQNYLKPDFRISKKSIDVFPEIYQEIKLLKEKLTDAEIVPLSRLFKESLELAIMDAAATDKATPLRVWKDKWLEKDYSGNFIVRSPLQIAKQKAVATIFEQYNLKLAKEGLFDFDDMIMLAIKGLEENPDLKYSLQERYQFIQLDEFQDTNEAQLRLVELLADNPINEGRPNILAVGDDDQAIYSFQGAHYSHMERFVSTYRNVEIIELAKNYRSSESIIKFSTNIRSQISDGLKIKGLDKKQVSAAETKGQASIIRAQFKTELEQYLWVADYVAAKIKAAKISANDIAIFAPKHKNLIELVPYLHAKGIPLNYEQQNDVLEDPKINELLVAAALIINIKDSKQADYLWPRVLSADYWQLSTSVIWELSLKAYRERRSWSELMLEHEELRKIALFFIRLNQIAEEAPFDLMLNYLCGITKLDLNETAKKNSSFQSPFYEHYFHSIMRNENQSDGQAWRLLGQLSILIARAKDHSEKIMNIAGFLEFCDSYKKAELKIIDRSKFREADNALNLMTAFASKGQEFDTVVIIDLIDRVWGKSAKQKGSAISLPANLAHVNIDSNSDDEKLRLLYVAASRAKRELILSGYEQSQAGRKSEPVAYLAEYEQKGIVVSPLLDKTNASIIKPQVKAKEIYDKVPLWWSRHLDDFNVENKALLKDRLETFRLNATNLNAYTNVIDGGPSTFFINEILKFPKARSERAEYGSAVHDTLDWMFNKTRETKSQVSLNSLLKQFELYLKERILSQHDFELLLARGKESLSIYYEQVPLIISESDLSEYGFSTEIAIKDSPSIRLKGQIDRLLIDPKAKTIQILDFKTGSSYDRFSESDIKPLHHKRQLYFYKLLIEHTARFKGYSVNSASIQFVEPDENGKIKKIDLYYDREESERFKNLVYGVWNNIMNLQFPKTDQYKDSVKGILQFENDLISKQ